MERRRSVRPLGVWALLDLEVRGRQGQLGQAWNSCWDSQGRRPVVATVSGVGAAWDWGSLCSDLPLVPSTD